MKSVLNQTHKEVELILVDGNSSDKTLEIIKLYEQKFKDEGKGYVWISEKDDGIYDAWNKGVKLANGDWIGFLGSDDRYKPNALELYNEVIERSPDLDFISSRIIQVKNGKFVRELNGKWKWQDFKNYMCLSHIGALHSKSYFERYGGFNTAFKIAGDYELLLRAGENLNYAFLDEITAEMNLGGVSNKMIYKTLVETKKAKIETANLSWINANLYFLYAFGKAKLKSWFG